MDKQLFEASRKGNLEEVKRRIENGSDINSKDSFGRTPLNLAAMNGHFYIVKYLIDKKANLDHKNFYGNTALHRASHNGHANIAKLLLDNDADPFVTNSDGETALDIANERKKSDVSNLLKDRMSKNVEQNEETIQKETNGEIADSSETIASLVTKQEMTAKQNKEISKMICQITEKQINELVKDQKENTEREVSALLKPQHKKTADLLEKLVEMSSTQTSDVKILTTSISNLTSLLEKALPQICMLEYPENKKMEQKDYMTEPKEESSGGSLSFRMIDRLSQLEEHVFLGNHEVALTIAQRLHNVEFHMFGSLKEEHDKKYSLLDRICHCEKEIGI